MKTKVLWALVALNVLVFIADDEAQAREEARDALTNYWRALEGTLDEKKVRNATDNASELVNDLRLGLNKARQATITREIIEVSAGAASQER